MYKTRFRNWGLQKTLKFDQVGELLRQNAGRAAAGKESVRMINGKRIDDRRLTKYIRSLSAEKLRELEQIAYGDIEPVGSGSGGGGGLASWATPSGFSSSASSSGSGTGSGRSTPTFSSAVISCRTPSPGPAISHLFHLALPDTVRGVEETMTVMRAYVSGAVDAGQWTLDAGEVVRVGPLFSFWNLARAAHKLLLTGNPDDTRQAFRLLNRCFHEYRELLMVQSPLLYPYTYLVGLVFADGYPDLFVSFVRYAANMARITLGDRHPLYMLLAGLHRMGPLTARRDVVPLTQAYINFCCLRPGSIAMLDAEAILSMQLSDMGVFGLDVTEGTLRRNIERLERYSHLEINQAIILDTRDDLALVLIRQGRYDEARDLLYESLQSPVINKFPLLTASCMRNIFFLERDQHHDDEALRAGHRLVQFAYDTWGLNDGKTIRVLTDLKEYLRKVGGDQNVERLDLDFETAMDEISRGIEVIDLSAGNNEEDEEDEEGSAT